MELNFANGVQSYTVNGVKDVLRLNPADAERLGIQDGGRLKVKTPIGERTYLAETVPGVLPGGIYIVHDDEGDQNVNDLIAADYLDPLSGFPGYRCYFCRVEPAGGAR